MTDSYVLSKNEIRLIRCLQEEFPLCERPFLQIAQKLDLPESEVIEMTRRLQEAGCLKRLAAVLYHTRVGYTVNAMLVWDVPEDRVDEMAGQVIRLPQVSHCYRRNRAEGFDYNLYTMVHAESENELDLLTDRLRSIILPVKFTSLRTKQELKKTGMKYFI